MRGTTAGRYEVVPGCGRNEMSEFASSALNEESDSVLVAATRDGEPEAFRLLVSRHEAQMLRVAFNITRDREDARDVVQESLHKAFINLDRFQEKAAFSTWLTRIVINEALMWLRKIRVRREVSLEGHFAESNDLSFAAIVDRHENPEEIYEREEKARSLFSAINQLNAEFRDAVDLHLKEHTLGEAAEILRVALDTVKARLFRARRQLRALIGRNARPTNQTSSLDRGNVQNGPFGKNKILGAKESP
jgi:RNA polymerase sigma-70 factor (ECF subfamily)